ncbi:hypothetical protein PCYB_072890 [Plasmodium cynomolgi strain B]|uniref:RAP domain-containing protein n=1 Tax=Plasmodium cynomolgi (strain B) TaxID=1120755 RepID=K6V9D7_PLACD|nr:hypothetical protein PCYB_072890 [Plasmodium cynomolgi strain B]GAB65787.1 hypothetical protein PCYB_072890 [Plasmodium cynomolgi strain B]
MNTQMVKKAISTAWTLRSVFPLHTCRFLREAGDGPFHRRRQSIATESLIKNSFLTKEYYDKMKKKKIDLFDFVPPENFVSSYFEKLDKCYSNPRSILRCVMWCLRKEEGLYKDYIEKEDYPNYNWLVRCFCQLANVFGFNSFWSVKDKQAIHELKLFKFLVYDLIERKEKIKSRHCPRLLYAMCCLDYRCYYLLPTILELIEIDLHKFRVPTLSMISFCLTYLGLTNQDVQFGSYDNLSRSYNLIEKILNRIYDRREEEKGDMTNFCWSLLAYVLVINNMYVFPFKDEGRGEISTSFLPEILKNACEGLTRENIAESGWIQYYLYMTLYCCDVEKPRNERMIKESVPFFIQEYLHLKWLDNILITAQNQGSEKMQLEMESIIQKLQLKNFFINLSVGRKIDEQHCFFASHFYKPLNLCIEYDYFHPIGFNRPLVSGTISLKNRIFKKLNFNVVNIHKCFWDTLTEEQKESQLVRVLEVFQTGHGGEKQQQQQGELYQEKYFDSDLLHLKHKRVKFRSWPPEHITV